MVEFIKQQNGYQIIGIVEGNRMGIGYIRKSLLNGKFFYDNSIDEMSNVVLFCIYEDEMEEIYKKLKELNKQ